MVFTDATLYVMIAEFIQLLLVALLYFVSSDIVKEADSIYEKTAKDPLGKTHGVDYRMKISSAKSHLEIAILMSIFAVLWSFMWQSARQESLIVIGSAVCLGVVAIMFARRGIRMAYLKLESEKISIDQDVNLSDKGIFSLGLASIQRATTEPLIVMNDRA